MIGQERTANPRLNAKNLRDQTFPKVSSMQPPENLPESLDPYQYQHDNSVEDAGFSSNYHFPAMQSYSSSSFFPWEDQSDVTDTPQDRALAASRAHNEAEKRRRERINTHLDTLRSLLSCNSKTDKATLLAKVIQRVKELKQQSSEINQLEAFPSEADEITVVPGDDSGGCDGRLILKASLCCNDRIDLIPDLIEMLKSLGLSPLKAEMITFGGRMRNVMIVTGEKGRSEDHGHQTVQFLREALASLVQHSNFKAGERSKRRKVFG
ncbi:hypothetical protein RJ639_005482 [Escallonia herrerae]|uniref:BHLH domain-containing protein n=1 Tax=Escallonia herrerae TaxID=1293975 RepID=A0AA88W145_9ASTE|nr:hypothetical protein RJ639_005482 [Escallonia herrerae]